MKRIIFFVSFFSVSLAGLAQHVENFNVGPYEVEYRSGGEYQYRLRQGIDLYDYYELKRDTVIAAPEQQQSPVGSAIQVNLSMSLPRYVSNGASNVWGVDGSWKQQIGSLLYFNAGLSARLSSGCYGWAYQNYKDWKDGSFSETMFEVGVPLSIELSKIDRKKASLYGGVGVVPTFYTGAKDEQGKTKSGLYVAPRLDVGSYLPVGSQLVRLGFFVDYVINCSTKDIDVFKDRIGQFFIGANVGLLF